MPPNPPSSDSQGSSSLSPPPFQASIWLRLALNPRTHPEIYLRGLEYWLELGLISDAEVRLQCSQLLTCPIQQRKLLAPERRQSEMANTAVERPSLANPLAEAIAQTPLDSSPEERGADSRQRSPVEVLGATLAAEFSLNWLLALGVFVVVASSGALAASQWQQVSNLGQYTILWGYTLAFFATGLWLGRSEKLYLTGQMVRAMALFLVPMNAWAMDGLRLWSSAIGSGLVAIAALSLVVLSRKAVSLRMGTSPSISTGVAGRVQGCALVLSGLQWGWGLSGWPLVATYVGAIVASIGFWHGEERWFRGGFQRQGDVLQSNVRRRETGGGTADASESLLDDRPTSLIDTETDIETLHGPHPTPTLLGRSLMLVGIALLLVRAGIDPRIEIPQLGLAIGLVAWQLGWIARSRQQPDLWTIASAALFLLGWQLTAETLPLQALGVSALAAWIVGDRLRRLWTLLDTLLLFGLVTQGQALVWFSLPERVQQALMSAAIQIFGSVAIPDSLVGLGLFPAVGLAVWGADWLRRHEKLQLAISLERAALALGVVLGLFAALNPGVRAVYFAVSTGVLAVLVRRRLVVSRVLVYLTHGVGVLAAAFVIDALFPQVGVWGWGAIAIAGAALEWGFVALSSRFELWRRSSWYLGFGLSITGYLIWLGYLALRLEANSTGHGLWRIGWFAVPIASAIVSQRSSLPLRLPPLAVTITGLIAGQLLTVETLATQLAGWAIAAVVMAVLTYCRPTVLEAACSLGFSLFGGAIAIAELPPEPIGVAEWMFVIAAVVFVLWLTRWLTRSRKLSPARESLEIAIGRALYGWGLGLGSLNLLLLFAYTIGLYLDGLPTSGFQVAAAWVMVAAIVVCATHQQLRWLEILGFAVAVELAIASLLALWTLETLPLATVNLGVGLALQIGGDLWQQRTGRAYPKGALVLPVVYAGWGFILSLEELRSYSGLYALGLALILLGLGRRRSIPSNSPWTGAGLLALTVAAYQTVLFQLMQASGGDAGDGIAILGGLAMAISWAYQTVLRSVGRYLRLEFNTLTIFGNLHWCGGSLLLLLAWVAPSSTVGDWIWVGSALGAATYAVVRGRTAATMDGELAMPARVADEFWLDKWMYAGIAWGAIAIAYSLLRFVPDSSPVTYWGGAIAVAICAPALLCPWQVWRWTPRPWHRAAMVLPGLVAGITLAAAGWQSFLMMGAYYAWLALRLRRIRLSYVALLFADVGLIQLLDASRWLSGSGLVLILAGSGLYAAQIDPTWTHPDLRETRHWLRMLLVSLICIITSVELEGITGWVLGGMIVGLAVAIAGLILRVRAYLYVGTVAFAILVLRQTWLAIMTSSVALWSIGILLGLGLIWIAATFEARRNSTLRQLKVWSIALKDWD
ncbi:MAG: hypothetical protein AB4050_01375 [Synechococcus sp.]